MTPRPREYDPSQGAYPNYDSPPDPFIVHLRMVAEACTARRGACQHDDGDCDDRTLDAAAYDAARHGTDLASIRFRASQMTARPSADGRYYDDAQQAVADRAALLVMIDEENR